MLVSEIYLVLKWFVYEPSPLNHKQVYLSVCDISNSDRSDLKYTFFMFLFSAALKRMLNFNAPPLKNTAAEPVWKVSLHNKHLGVSSSTMQCFLNMTQWCFYSYNLHAHSPFAILVRYLFTIALAKTSYLLCCLWKSYETWASLCTCEDL